MNKTYRTKRRHGTERLDCAGCGQLLVEPSLSPARFTTSLKNKYIVSTAEDLRSRQKSACWVCVPCRCCSERYRNLGDWDEFQKICCCKVVWLIHSLFMKENQHVCLWSSIWARTGRSAHGVLLSQLFPVKEKFMAFRSLNRIGFTKVPTERMTRICLMKLTRGLPISAAKWSWLQLMLRIRTPSPRRYKRYFHFNNKHSQDANTPWS